MNRFLHRLLIVLIFTFVSASAYLFFPNNNPPLPRPSGELSTLNSSSTPRINLQQEDIKPAILKNNGTDKTVSKKTEAPPPITTADIISDQQKPETIPIVMAIEDKEYKIEVKPGSSAYEAMNNLRENRMITFSAKNFSGLGYFIEEINGLKNSPSTGFYWTLYINNQEARVGVSNYTLKSNDIITWKYVRK